jgi:hypothetical protein
MLAKGLPEHGLGWPWAAVGLVTGRTSRGLGCQCAGLAPVCAGRAIVYACYDLDIGWPEKAMGCVGHVLRWTWARLDMVWDEHELDRPWSVPDMIRAGYILSRTNCGQPWAWPAMSWAVHGL